MQNKSKEYYTMKNNIAFLTTIFPMKEKYLNDFFDSLVSQTFQEFDIIVVNDGYKNFKELVKQYSVL